MANLQDILSASRLGSQAAAQYAPPEEQGDLMDNLHSVAGVGLGAVASVGNFLDLPGSSVRDILAGANPFDQWLSPLSDENRITGRDLLTKYGMRKNKETGLAGWADDPGEGARDFAGFLAEVVLDPFGPVTKPLMLGTGLGRAAAGAAGRAHPLARMLGRGAVKVFDTIPANATKATLGSAYRGVKSLFHVPSHGVTDPIIMGMAEKVHPIVEKIRVRAVAHATEIGMAAKRAGFDLEVNKTYDTSDPTTWMQPDSQLQVNAREEAIGRYLEGVETPGQLDSRDLVTVGDTPELREVEWVNRDEKGAVVKLVNDETIYRDHQLKETFLHQKVQVPEELKHTLNVIKEDIDSLHGEAQGFGLKIGTDHDPYTKYGVGRSKSNEIRHLEALTGMDRSSWRRGYTSLVASLVSTGGRDIVYKAFADGTHGVNGLFGDKYFQNLVEGIDGRSIESTDLINGAHPNVLNGMVGIRHIEPIANQMGMTGEELWDSLPLRREPRVPKTAVGIQAVSPNQVNLIDSVTLSKVGSVDIQFRTEGNSKVATIAPDQNLTGQALDALDDNLPTVEKTVRESGVDRLEVTTTPAVGDSFWQTHGYRRDSLLPDGNEKWIKDVYPGMDGVDASLTQPRMAPIKEVMDHLWAMKEAQNEAVRTGKQPGILDKRGWWSHWDDVSDRTGQLVHTFKNKDVPNFTEIDPSTMQVTDFPSRTDYDRAVIFQTNGRKVYIAEKVLQKGQPPVKVVVTPSIDSKMGNMWKSIEKSFRTNVEASPLQAREATIDHLHQAITRNYGDRVDQWMPQLDEHGMVNAVKVNGKETEVFHSDYLKGWRKLLPQIQEKVAAGKPLVKSMRALLRLNDESLQALMFNKENIELVHEMRTKYNAVTAEANQKMLDQIDVDKDYTSRAETAAERNTELLEQDLGIGLLDRHQALAMELANHVEKRMAPVFSRSAAVTGSDYLAKNGSAVSLIKATRDTLTDMYEKQLASTGGKADPGNIVVKHDKDTVRGITLAEAMEGNNGLFADKVDADTFLENTRQHWIDRKIPGFVATEDPDVILAQIERIKGIRASADVFHQMKTLNEIPGAADLPEMGFINRSVQSMNAWFKSGQLAYTPATAIRDGLSSFVNASIMGDQNPITAIAKHGSRAWDFIRGGAVDPGEGIPEIEEFLKLYQRPSTPQTRGEAFQNLWNAHHHGGAMHPNVFKADEAAMEGADSSMRLVEDMPTTKPWGGQIKQGFMKAVKGGWNPLNSNNDVSPFKVAGAWGKDKAGRAIQHTESNAAVTLVNAFRGKVDLLNRAMYVLNRLDTTKSLSEAFQMSDKVLLNANPRNFTRFEHKYLKSVVPYYSFMRQSIPMFIKELVTNPGGPLGMTIRASRLGQGDEKGYVPFQYQDTAAIPIGKGDDGSLKYLTSLGLMHEDTVNYAGNAMQGDVRGLLQKAISNINPVPKWLVEYSTNTSLYSQGPMGGRRLDDLDPTMGRLLVNLGMQDLGPSGRATPFVGSMAESIAAASPASRLLSIAKIATADPARSGPVEKVIRLLSGFKVEHVSPEQITRDIRDRLNALQIKSGARPLTIVSGTEKLMERMVEQGDAEGAAELDKITRVLSALRKQVGGTGTSKKKDDRPKTKALIDRLRANR